MGEVLDDMKMDKEIERAHDRFQSGFRTGLRHALGILMDSDTVGGARKSLLDLLNTPDKET